MIRVSVAVFLLLIAMAFDVSAMDHIVGGNRGWNPNINYTQWVKNQTFIVGDWISFRYQKDQHNVLQVNKTGYDNCTTDSVIGNWSSGKDFIELNESKRYYFIDGKGFCYNGMKITLFVENPAPPPHEAVANTTAGDKTSDGGCPLQPVGLSFSGLLLLGGALLGL
eukprot:TRINITY_DN6509_c0_g1_i1.p1 TRINITY_DN6509_c0_g1~~TRINITY_DN6509_c0_g1_i1.p1  ORF type:complete len:166 (+),score=17.19 TRINITY_DN6509_c0_g1_i1:400-897(+)